MRTASKRRCHFVTLAGAAKCASHFAVVNSRECAKHTLFYMGFIRSVDCCDNRLSDWYLGIFSAIDSGTNHGRTDQQIIGFWHGGLLGQPRHLQP